MIELALLVFLAQDTTFRATVPVVMVPVTVKTADGRYIDGLSAEDFVLLDDGIPRTFQLDTSDTVAFPLGLVVAVQANNTAPAALKKIQRIGSMIQPLITGERGRAAILTFGSEVKLAQDFTSDADKLTRSFRSMRTQSGKQARLLDAAEEGIRMLAEQPDNQRRVLLTISESRDRGSDNKLEEVVRKAQEHGVSVYAAVFSAYVTPFTTKAGDLPPSEGGGLIEVFKELGRLGKTNSAQALAGFTGGRKVSFATLRGLEGVITETGEELHSQYILTYTNSKCVPGFHRIQVKVKDHPNAEIRARFGYWTDETACAAGATQ